VFEPVKKNKIVLTNKSFWIKYITLKNHRKAMFLNPSKNSLPEINSLICMDFKSESRSTYRATYLSTALSAARKFNGKVLRIEYLIVILSLSQGHGESSGCGWRNGLQIWRVAANILNKQSWTAEKGWSSRLVVGEGANNSSP
jgi:hypothetical protein